MDEPSKPLVSSADFMALVNYTINPFDLMNSKNGNWSKSTREAYDSDQGNNAILTKWHGSCE